MNVLARICLALMIILLAGAPVLAQPDKTKGEPPAETEPAAEPVEEATVPNFGPGFGAGIGMGLSVIGIGVGLGLIGFAALSGMARQPEQATQLSGTMILMAALVEGAGIIAIILCFVVALIGG